MLTRWLFAAVHLLGFGIGLGSAWARGQAFRGELDPAGLRRVFYADNWWGVSALLLIGTGLVRAFGRLEKGSAYYLHNHLFLTKMAFLGLILVLEIAPMLTLIRWRMQVRRGEQPDTRSASRFANTSSLQAVLLILMLLAATGMARGWGQ
jgi:putative membrane protein